MPAQSLKNLTPVSLRFLGQQGISAAEAGFDIGWHMIPAHARLGVSIIRTINVKSSRFIIFQPNQLYHWIEELIVKTLLYCYIRMIAFFFSQLFGQSCKRNIEFNSFGIEYIFLWGEWFGAAIDSNIPDDDTF